MKLDELLVGEEYAYGERYPDGRLPTTCSKCRYLGPATEELLNEHGSKSKVNPEYVAVLWLHHHTPWVSVAHPTGLIARWVDYQQELTVQREQSKPKRHQQDEQKAIIDRFLDHVTPGWKDVGQHRWEVGPEVRTTERLGKGTHPHVVLPVSVLIRALKTHVEGGSAVPRRVIVPSQEDDTAPEMTFEYDEQQERMRTLVGGELVSVADVPVAVWMHLAGCLNKATT